MDTDLRRTAAPRRQPTTRKPNDGDHRRDVKKPKLIGFIGFMFGSSFPCTASTPMMDATTPTARTSSAIDHELEREVGGEGAGIRASLPKPASCSDMPTAAARMIAATSVTS